jgi:methionine biosynthesis protein MetW
MKKNGVKEFEDRRWRGNNQVLVFRHTEALGMVSKEQKVLDIGCGDGLLLSALAKAGVSASGVDVSDEGVKKCREKGFDVSVADISTEDLPFQDKAFDTVIMLDILEHLYDPEVLLREAIRVSKQNIIISVPNFNSLPARMQVLLGRVPENNFPNKGHIYWFNHPVLMILLKRNGLQIEKISRNTFWEHNFFIGGIMKKLCLYFPNIFALSFVVKANIKAK